MRLTIILRENLCDSANAAIAERTGNPADAYTFTNPLLRNGTPVARWCCWNFAGRRYTPQQVVAKLADTLGLSGDEILTRNEATGTPPDLRNVRMVAFDADRVNPERVLNYLGLTVPEE